VNHLSDFINYSGVAIEVNNGVTVETDWRYIILNYHTTSRSLPMLSFLFDLFQQPINIGIFKIRELRKRIRPF